MALRRSTDVRRGSSARGEPRSARLDPGALSPAAVRETVGLPEDRLVIAVLALGWPKLAPRKGPKRRPLAHVAHFNHYAGRAIPSSTKPADLPADLLAVYQRARVLNGLRHNHARAWEVKAPPRALRCR